ncbi:MAG: hypothetical protein GXO00_01820 [Candidatus Diapherotrites archaeon]|nr:hypothetical protein [Candidatus Diapherotrites archaeon]
MELTIVYLALADAVNPCSIAIMALLLLVVLSRRGRRDALLAGLLFTATVFVLYTLYGLGILNFFPRLLELLRALLLPFIFLLFLWELKAFLFYEPGFSSLEMPASLRPLASRLISKVDHPLMAVPVALFCSLFLLPCSSGPYLLALGQMGGIIDLLLYNLIFISPFLLLLLLVLLGLSPKRMLEFRERYSRHFHLLSALVLFLLLLYLLPSSSTGNGTLLLVADPLCPHCQNLERYLHEMNLSYTLVDRETAMNILAERNIPWNEAIPLLIGENVVVLGFPSKSQEIYGFFPREENLCLSLGGTPHYECNRYQYCVLPGGMLLGNKRVLEYIREGILK